MPRLSAQQLEDRRHGIGSSDVAAIVGASPWATAADVYYDKVDGVTKPSTPEMELGHELEGTILDLAATRLDVTMKDGGSYRSGWRSVNYDGIANTGRWCVPVEAKLVGPWSIDDWESGPPEHVLLQLQWQLDMAMVPFGYIAALLGGTRFETYRIERDEALCTDLVAACSAFWHGNVLARIPPDVAPCNGHAKRPTSDVAIQATPELEAAAEVWRTAKAQAKAADEAKARVLALMAKEGGNIAVLSSGQRLRWSERAGNVSWERAARAAGVTTEQAEAFRSGVPYPVLTVGK